MQVKAQAKNLRVSPEKLNLVISEIKKMSPAKALSILDFVPKKSAPMVKKAIASAVANAKNNFGLDELSLAFKEIIVNKGPVFKRFRPIARGRLHHILKRTSHLTVVLEGEEKKKSSNVSDVSKVSKEPEEEKPDKAEDQIQEKELKNEK